MFSKQQNRSVMFARTLLLAASACLPLALFFSACEDETDKNRAAILGRWEVRKAFRNQKETGSLAGAYFQFGPDGKMQTNIVESEEPADYTVSNHEIEQKGAQTVRYLIQEVSDSTLALAMTLRGVDFELQLARASVATESTPGDDEMAPPDSIAVPADMDTLHGNE